MYRRNLYSLYHGCEGKAYHQGHAHGHLGEAPSTSKISCSNFFVDVHFERVSVASITDAVDPAKHDISAVGALDRCQGKNAQAGQDEAGLGQVLARDTTFRRLAGQYQAEG